MINSEDKKQLSPVLHAALGINEAFSLQGGSASSVVKGINPKDGIITISVGGSSIVEKEEEFSMINEQVAHFKNKSGVFYFKDRRYRMKVEDASVEVNPLEHRVPGEEHKEYAVSVKGDIILKYTPNEEKKDAEVSETGSNEAS